MVANTMPEEYWSRLSERIAEQMGLHFPPDRLQDLRRGILAAASDLQFDDPEQGIEKLLASPLSRRQVEVLAAHLGVGETYFFRDPNTVETLRKHILPGLIAARSQAPRCLRIWVAGCASGEEAYSAATPPTRNRGAAPAPLPTFRFTNAYGTIGAFAALAITSP